MRYAKAGKVVAMLKFDFALKKVEADFIYESRIYHSVLVDWLQAKQGGLAFEKDRLMLRSMATYALNHADRSLHSDLVTEEAKRILMESKVQGDS